jgi:hypothetical protein
MCLVPSEDRTPKLPLSSGIDDPHGDSYRRYKNMSSTEPFQGTEDDQANTPYSTCRISPVSVFTSKASVS